MSRGKNGVRNSRNHFMLFSFGPHLTAFMDQSIPAVPIPPRATAGHLLTLPVPGVGHSQFYRGPGGRLFYFLSSLRRGDQSTVSCIVSFDFN